MKITNSNLIIVSVAGCLGYDVLVLFCKNQGLQNNQQLKPLA
jgi:hypothetical protein